MSDVYVVCFTSLLHAQHHVDPLHDEVLVRIVGLVL